MNSAAFSVFLVFIAAMAVEVTPKRSYELEAAGAWHLHTFFFEVKESSVDEALEMRRTLRELINNGTLEECSLNQIYVGWYGPFPVSQYEMCCNSTSFNAAHSFMAMNHGNLSVFIHPLTRYDVIDHTQRASWMGEKIPIDMECPCWYPELPKPKPCPVYPEYSDRLPEGPEDYEIPVPGTDDYWNLNKNFNILTDSY